MMMNTMDTAEYVEMVDDQMSAKSMKLDKPSIGTVTPCSTARGGKIELIEDDQSRMDYYLDHDINKD